MMRKIIGLITQAWDNVIILTPSLEKIETNSQFAQIVSPNETIALITLNISIGNVEGMINICIPHIVIEPILNQLSTKLWFSTTKKDVSNNDKEIIEKRIKNAYVVLGAILSSTQITVKELIDLQVGDVIKLDNKLDDEVKINVGSSLKFYGIPGSNKNKVAVKITRVQRDGDDLDA